MKRTLYILIMLSAWLTISAQDVMEQINKIKLQGGYLTAQYSHESADSAYSMGVRDILHQLNLKGYGVFTLSEISSKVGHLDMKRGNQTRVFSYLNMADISKKADTNVSSETVKIQPKFTVKEETPATPSPQRVAAAEPTRVSPEPSHVSPQPQKVSADDPQTQMARDIMGQKDINAAMNILKVKKNAGLILGYGPFAKGTNIDDVYIAIFDRNTSVPIAVLSPTIDGKRSNLITKGEDSLSNYHGCKAIWISF